MAKFYSNENFPRRTVEALRRLGHDVLTSFESGRANQRIPDDEVLAYAADEGRAVLTLNRRDFVELHGANPEHAGIVVTSYMPDPEAWAARIEAAIPESDTDLAGCLVRALKPSADSGKFTGCLQGGVLLLGSLYWEDLKGRKEWRDERLSMDQQTKVSGLPMRYGKWSEGRNEYTMCLVSGTGGGTAVLAPLKRQLAVVDGKLTARGARALHGEVDDLAGAEGLLFPKQALKHVSAKAKAGRCPWGCVALWTRPEATMLQGSRESVLKAHWEQNLSHTACLASRKLGNMHAYYGAIFDQHGLISLQWPAAVPPGIDFILCTPTLPDDPLPTPAKIAQHAGNYFDSTTASGIITEEDEEIRKQRP